MNILIVYAHPEPTSFTAALKDAAVQSLEEMGHMVAVSDLYAESFNPVAGRHDFTTVADPNRFHYQNEQLNAALNNGFSDELVREQERLLRADMMVFVFPVWWGGMPAILKGWFERVLAYGIAYSDGKRFESGYFFGKRGMLCMTTGGTKERFSEGGTYGEMDNLLYPTRRGMLEYIGLEVTKPFVAYATPSVDLDTRKKYLRDWIKHLGTAVNDPSWHARLNETKHNREKNRIITEQQGWNLPK